ncbi:MAG TPA: tetratricopeptide repeat protein [Thermoanaerobaculia bacterium]
MVRRRTSWILVACLAVLAAIAAVAAAVPPNLSKAIEAQQRLAAERPNDAAVYNDLGNLLLLVPRPEEAEAAYRKALELDPNKASAHYNLGLLLQQRGETREAMKHYEQTVKLEPLHAWAHYQMGTLHERWGNESRAVDEYAQAFALDPQLAFPEVNPHIVENKLVTEAMLRAYKGDYAPPQAPKVYEDPARIANLLVTNPEAAAKEQVANAPQPQPNTPANRQQQPPGGQAQNPGQVLRERDLDRGNPAGQAVPQGMSRGRVTGVQPQRGLREWNRPDPTIQENPEGMTNEEVEPGPVVTPPPGGVYYRPGVPSTGRLSLHLVPQRQRTGRG